jgi:zinc protease
MIRHRWVMMAAAVTLVLAGRAWAQGGQQGESNKAIPLSKVERLNRAPVSKEILRVTLPRPKSVKLDNGLTVLVVEQHKLPTMACALWIETGSLRDPKDLPGLASFTAEMLREGTTHRSSSQLAAEVDDIGASLNGFARFGSNTSSVSASGLVENADRILELMSDIVLNPTFPADELDKFKKRELAQLEQQRSQPSFLSREKFYQVLYRGFPASVTSPTPDSVNKVTPGDLKRFHDSYYLPGNAILGVIGDVEFDQIVPLIRKYFGDWKPGAMNMLALPALPAPAAARIYLIDRPGSVQTNIVAGDYSVRRNDPDYIPLVVMNRVLGGGPAARLFLDLREAKGLTYGAYSELAPDIYRGPWVARTEVRTQVTDQAMQALLDQFKKIREEKVPEAELDEARRSLVAGFALSLEQPATILNDWLTVTYYRLPEDYWDRYPEQLAKVSQEDVQRMAQKYVDLDHLQTVCVGDGKQIKSVLAKYGTVEEYDVNGKLVASAGAQP